MVVLPPERMIEDVKESKPTLSLGSRNGAVLTMSDPLNHGIS
jgi:hypothetical protein